MVEYVFDTYLNRDEYDMRELSPDPFPTLFYVDYLNTPEVQIAIGAYQNFSESNNAVSDAFTSTGDDGREYGTIGMSFLCFSSHFCLSELGISSSFNPSFMNFNINQTHHSCTEETSRAGRIRRTFCRRCSELGILSTVDV